MRILIMTDSLFIPTGLGRVGREIAMSLQRDGHDIGYIGWWHRSDIQWRVPPGMVYWPTNDSHYGEDVFDHVVTQFQPDVVLTIGDLWAFSYIPHSRTRNRFQWCCYIAVDGEPENGGLAPSLIRTVEDIDIPIAYTNYAREAILKSVSDSETRRRLKVIYHGVDTEIFKPMEWEKRQAIRAGFGLSGKFLFLLVCRNQTRKNIPEMLRAWKIFSELDETKGNVVFWPHMNFNDPAGWPISDILEVQRLRNQSIMYYQGIANGQSEMHLLPNEELAKLYQIADAFILISGEGFGLPTLEAMATRVPCILLDYAASHEIGAEGRAEMVSYGASWTGIHLTKRPLPEPERIVESMLRIYRDPERRKAIASAGYEFAKNYTWEKIGNEWRGIFNSIDVPFLSPVEFDQVS